MRSGLFSEIKLGNINLRNRIVMAPLTRCRADLQHVPTPIMRTYYRQRATAGLIVSEATMVMEGNSAFYREPGIYSAVQAEQWKYITDAVHGEDGRIFLQLWHGGRACHSLLNNGIQPVAPSPLKIENDETHTPLGKKPYEVPRALSLDEIPRIVDGFAQAARFAKSAGFDGVELHAANGYLIDEFLRDGSNQRTDMYGGSIENRARLMLEVVDALTSVWSKDSVGVRISPLNSYNFMKDSNPIELTKFIASALDMRKIAYLHLIRRDLAGIQTGDVLTAARDKFSGVLISNGGYNVEEAQRDIAMGSADAIAFGHLYVSNPDLVERVEKQIELALPEPSTLYSHEEMGYIDYPTWEGLVG